ncbi:hypothetical protein [Pseudomonas koreensis]|uniref:hypothetical protein n=1 Tax=Pseudomonas koreensis TaxID=198620 RepID=UPI001B343CFE|nr:hypothetical protein [Pseudomonas koreensis]MBP4001373.1 hypothetical protein [Pseudomonas koreensis]
MLVKILYLIDRLIVRLFFFLIWLFGATIFFGAMDHYLRQKNFLFLATLCFPILAVLFGFSALLYNRSRAFQPGPVQRRSLYAAERALQSTVLFALGLGSGSIIATIIVQLNLLAGDGESQSKLLLIFFIPIMLVLSSFGTFFFSFRAISHGMIKRVSTREMLRKIR